MRLYTSPVRRCAWCERWGTIGRRPVPRGVPGMFGIVFTACVLTAPGAGPIELEPGDLKPGLVAEYRSVAEPKARVSRIEPKPAFTLGRSSPHPRISPGRFEVTYTGVLQIKDAGAITFSAVVGGDL